MYFNSLSLSLFRFPLYLSFSFSFLFFFPPFPVFFFFPFSSSFFSFCDRRHYVTDANPFRGRGGRGPIYAHDCDLYPCQFKIPFFFFTLFYHLFLMIRIFFV